MQARDKISRLHETLEKSLKEHIDLIKTIPSISKDVFILAQKAIDTLKNGSKILIMGNGGSAADSQHMATEIAVRYKKDRKALPAIALTTDTSIITAAGNDFSFDLIFVKQIQALGKPEDMALGITTSGTSANVIKGLATAREIGLFTAALTGGNFAPTGELSSNCDLILNVPSDSTPHIQETHLWVEHLLCEMVEKTIFKVP